MDAKSFQSKSNHKLRQFIHKKIQKMFQTYLTHLELALSEQPQVYKKLRTAILDIGNEAIRECEKEILDNYTAEYIPTKYMVLLNNKYKGQE